LLYPVQSASHANRIYLSAKDSECFFQVMKSPPEPNQRLKEAWLAYSAHRDTVDEVDEVDKVDEVDNSLS
jgi:hypothetical protein